MANFSIYPASLGSQFIDVSPAEIDSNDFPVHIVADENVTGLEIRI